MLTFCQTVGAGYASLQASSHLASAELQVKEELAMAEQALLGVKRENVVKVGKEENREVKLDAEFVKEEVKKFDKMEIIKIPNSEEVKVTVIESEITRKV